MALLCSGLSTNASALTPALWGYGVRSCAEYEQANAAAKAGDSAEFQRYQDWAAGFVSGLSLALDEDVLSGSGIETLMRRTLNHCKAHPSDNFFTATMHLVRLLSSLR
ncbi:MAG: hypothetical protein VBE63_24055 [Lamprobacter sp.]|uniref:hypothetical protein n=1 Tax=Lamprobacter sp. TaxID=3100796 RepID=UPI002B25B2EB|nr:hypothetical protein [Lamprobacter sp.]MEA3642989.1 hypothetical protein [Lamprobacter sp.]